MSTGDYRLLEDTTTLLTGAMWFAVGTAAVVALDEGVPWRVLLYCLAALRVVRVVPALVAPTRSSLPRRDRLLVAVLGPRGTTTIVFGLLAFNGLPTRPDADTVLLVTVVCVLASVLLQGPVAGGLARRFLRDDPDRPGAGAPPGAGAAARPVLDREDG